MSKPPVFTREELLAKDATPIVVQHRTVKFQDVDAAGTIFFPRVLEYFSDAYQELLDRSGLDVPRLLRDKALAAPLAHAQADYFAPLFYGDAVDVAIVRARIGTSSVSLGHRITKGETVTSVGITVHVFVDAEKFQPSNVPVALREFLSR